MGRAVLVAAGTVTAAAALVFAVILAGIRWQIGPVLDAVRRFNKARTNPRVLKTAGTADSATALVRHSGRTSGRVYETPVDVVETATGFLIALPYGANADWVRNIVAAGSAAVITRGATVEVEAPLLVPTSTVADQLPRGTRAVVRVFGVAQCLQLTRSG